MEDKNSRGLDAPADYERQSAPESDGFERRSRKKRERILKAAGDLFMRFGFQKVAVSEVAEAAGVSQVTIYKYFEDKTGLAEAVLVEFLETTRTRYVEIFRSPLPFSTRLEQFMRVKAENARTFEGEFATQLYKHSPQLASRLIQERKQLFERYTAPFLDDGRAQGIVDSEIDNETILVYLDLLSAGLAARPDILEKHTGNYTLLEQMRRLTMFGFIDRRVLEK